MTKKKSKWLLTKARHKIRNLKRAKNLITVKTVLQCRILKAREGDVNEKSTNYYKVYTM